MKNKPIKDTELDEAIMLHQAFENLVKHHEPDAYDSFHPKWIELKGKLIERYLPVVRDLTRAGMLSFMFHVRSNPLEVEHHLEFDACSAHENGIIIVEGDQSAGGSTEFYDAFDALCKGLPDYRGIELERLNRFNRMLQEKIRTLEGEKKEATR